MTSSDEMMKIYVDGGAFPNNPQGQKYVGVQFEDGSSFTKNTGYGTNNEAEYEAVLEALKEASKRGLKSVTILSDSMLVLQQFSGQWKVAPKFMRYLEEFAQIKERFDEISMEFIRGELNPAHELLEREWAKILGFKVFTFRKSGG